MPPIEKISDKTNWCLYNVIINDDNQLSIDDIRSPVLIILCPNVVRSLHGLDNIVNE